MSDEIVQVVEKDLAKPVLESIEKVGEAVPRHFGEIGEKLEQTVARHAENEAGIVAKIEGVGRQDAPGTLGGLKGDAGGLPPGGGAGPGGSEPLGVGDPAREAQPPGAQGASDDPVDVATGQMFLPQRDLSLPGLLPLALERTHRSDYRKGRWFGRSWASTLDQRLEIDDDGIHYAAPDGVVLHYPVPAQPGVQVLPSEGARWPLTWDRTADTILVEQPESGRTLHFPPGPTPEIARPLYAVVDRNGNRITVVCDAEGVPTDVYHSGGYHVLVESTAAGAATRIAGLRLADPAGGPDLGVVSFGYDALGRLTETVDPAGLPLAFDYDDADRITSWTDRNGHRYEYAFDDSGRVARANGSGGFLAATFEYDDEARTTTLTDSLGHPTVYHRNERGQVVKVVDALGGVRLAEQDRYGRLLATTDPLGRTTRFTLDERGDPVRVDQPDGTSVLVAYGPLRKPTRVTRPGGEISQYAYDERGNLTSRSEPGGGATSYGYDERGRLLSVTDALGNTTRCQSDPAGLPLASTDPTGASIRVERDPFGRPVALTDPAGAVTRMGWTARDRLAWRTAPDGGRTEWSYDPEGNLLAARGPAGGETRFEYGPFDRQTARVDPSGASYRFDYDTELRLTAVTGPDGLTWTYAYDPCDSLVGERDFNGRAVTYRVDAAGQLAERINAAGEAVSFTRDAAGRVVERRAGATRQSLAYDPAGRLVEARSADSVLAFAHDAAGRVLTETVDGRTLTNEYDVLGRRVRRTTPTGVVSQWTYDAAGRPLGLDNSGGALSFEYDAAGRETSRFLGPGAALSQSFDELGRLTAQAVWAYDGSNDGYRPLQRRGYRYRSDGVPVEITDQLRGDRGYQLDSAGRVTAVRAAAWSETYAYDAMGNVVEASYPGEEQENGGHGDGGGRHDRDYSGTLIRRAGRTTYEHDAQGRVVRTARRTLSGQTRTWAYTWDADDRLTQIVTPDGATWRYTYDPLGRRTAKQRLGEDGGVAEETLFTFEGARLAEQSTRLGGEAAADGHGRINTLTWDWQPRTVRPVAQVGRSWATDTAQADIDTAQADIDTAQADIDTAFYAIVTDLVGTPSELVTPDGRIAWHTTTSLWGATIDAPDAEADCPLRFPGQYHDVETGLDYNHFRYYDPDVAGYASPDPLGLAPAPNQYRYVDNPLAAADPLGLSPYPTGPKPPYEWAPPNAPTGVLEPGEAWDPSQGTPVIGRLPDTEIAGTWPGYSKLVARGSGWSPAKNDAWVQTIIDQRGSVYSVSSLKDNYWNVARAEPTVYAREVQQLLGAGYTWNGDHLIPPTP